MGKSKAPAPPSPTATSAAQTGTNISTAVANAFLTNPSVNTPYGSQTMDATGSHSWTDPYTGQTYDVPTFTVNQNLSEAEQGIFNQDTKARTNLATLGADLSGTLGDQLRGNFSLGNEETEARLFELGSKRLDPRFQREDTDLRTRLANQGIKAGSDAYDREMSRLGEQENDAFNQLLLNGRGMANQELLAEDNQRFNQISALMSGGQVSQPNFNTGTSIGAAPTTDNASIIGNNYNQQMQAWQQNQAATGATLSGLGNLAGSLFSLSDERAKEDVEQIGSTEDGLGIYSYRYKGSPRTEIGLMAQEVKRMKPDAVRKRPDGLMSVNYEAALGA